MSTSEPQKSEQQEGDELVAYLDGELPADDSRRVEERLAADAEYREQLRELDQAWEALDSLPKATASDDFARTTIEMVAVHAERDLSQREVQVAHANRWQRLRWAAAGVAVAIISYAVASALLPSQDQKLLADLPVIRQIDYLKPISDIEFLRELSNRVSVAQLVQNEQAHNREVKAIEAASAPIEQRHEWVQSLPEEDKYNLWAQQDRFYNQSSDDERERLRKLQAELAAAPDREKLEATLVAYYQWFNDQGDNTKGRLRDGDLSASRRVDEVLTLVDNVRELGDDEEKQLREEIRVIATEMKPAFRRFVETKPANRPEEAQQHEQLRADLLKFIDDKSSPPAAIEYLIIYWALVNEDTSQSTRERLLQKLDERTVAFLRTPPGPQQGGRGRRGGRRGDPLIAWSLDSMQSLRTNYNSTELRRFFSKGLDRETQRRLAEYSFAEMEAEVARLKKEQDLQVSAFERFMGIGRGGRGRGGRAGGGGGGGGQGPPPGPPRGEEPEPPPRGGRSQRRGSGDNNQDNDRRNRNDKDNDDNDNRRRRDN